jgi:hypothetical protein
MRQMLSVPDEDEIFVLVDIYNGLDLHLNGFIIIIILILISDTHSSSDTSY